MRPATFRGTAIFLGCLVLPALMLNELVSRLDLPDYGTWTGIRPLDEKLRRLEAFGRAGEVDALVLGSSVADFGLCTERLSERLSSASGRPYRCFNFSTGAAEVASFPLLYRLARTVAKPRLLLLVLPASARREDRPREEIKETPEYFLARAPVGRALRSEALLQASKRLWSVPVVRHATALREWLCFGSFRGLKGAGADLYPLAPGGSRVSYTYDHSGANLEHWARTFGASLELLEASGDRLLSREDLEGLTELKALAARDGFELAVAAHSPAAALLHGTSLSDAARRGRRRYLEGVARRLGARLYDFLDEFRLERFAIADYIHLNHYGASAYADALAAAMTGAALPPPVRPRLPDLDRDDPLTFNAFSFVLLRDGQGEGTRLALRFVRSIAVPPLVEAPLLVALRLPDGSDAVVPAVRGADGEIVAAFAGLDRAPGVLVGRLLTEAGGRRVALNQPLAAYRWIP